MKVKDIKDVISPFTPIWINDNDTSELYLSAEDIPEGIENKEVVYLTTDGNNELTIEL